MPAKPRSLGHVQLSILRSLKDHRGWSPGCGWLWNNYSGTKRLLDSLVKRGLATVTPDQGDRRYPTQDAKYLITPAGLALVETPFERLKAEYAAIQKRVDSQSPLS